MPLLQLRQSGFDAAAAQSWRRSSINPTFYLIIYLNQSAKRAKMPVGSLQEALIWQVFTKVKAFCAIHRTSTSSAHFLTGQTPLFLPNRHP
jgi:hypothetical protein